MALRHTLLLCALAALALAGCTGDSGGRASVSFDGNGNGSHDDSTSCNSDGTLVAHGQVDDGQVTARITDSDGKQLYTKTFDGGFNADGERLNGASGSWRITATRSSDTVLGTPFRGDYTFTLTC